MPNPTYNSTLTSTQSGGAVSVTLPPRPYPPVYRHSAQVEVTLTATGVPATATAGTLSVRARHAGATTFQELGTINLAAPNLVVFDGFWTDFQAVSTGFDADKTWVLNISDGN